MKRRNIPLILMLVAGAVTGIITCVKGYSIVEKLTVLLISLVVFYLIGVCFKTLLDVFDRQNAERQKAEEEAEQEQAQRKKNRQPVRRKESKEAGTGSMQEGRQ